MKLHVQQSWTHSVMALERLNLRITFWRFCVCVCVCVVAGTSSSKVGQQQKKERAKTHPNFIMRCLQAQDKESVTLTCFGAVFDYVFLIIYIKSHQWWTDDTHAVFGSLNKAQLLICRSELPYQTNTEGKLQLPTEVCNHIFRCACAVKGCSTEIWCLYTGHRGYIFTYSCAAADRRSERENWETFKRHEKLPRSSRTAGWVLHQLSRLKQRENTVWRQTIGTREQVKEKMKICEIRTGQNFVYKKY